MERVESGDSLANGETPIKNPTYARPLISIRREVEPRKESNLILNKISSTSLSNPANREASPR